MAYILAAKPETQKPEDLKGKKVAVGPASAQRLISLRSMD